MFDSEKLRYEIPAFAGMTYLGFANIFLPIISKFLNFINMPGELYLTRTDSEIRIENLAPFGGLVLKRIPLQNT